MCNLSLEKWKIEMHNDERLGELLLVEGVP